MSELYKQCLLCKGSSMLVSWIPSKFAKKNKVLELKMNKEWVNGWTVLTAFGEKKTKDNLTVIENQCKETRKVSDI